MSTIRKWEQFDRRELNQRVEKQMANGIRLEISASPYDIPEAYRGYYCQDQKKFVVEFRYLGDEATTSRALGEHLTVEEGKNSGRMYRLLIDVDALEATSIEVLLNNIQILPPPANSRRASEVDRSRINRNILETVSPSLGRLASRH